MSDVIKEDTHRGWLAQRLANPECLLFIAEDSKGTALGHVRIEPVEDEFIISVNVAPEARGSGYASTMIAKVTERAHRVQPHARVIALIKPCNSRSVRAFIGAGYRHSGTQTVAGIEALRMIWEPEQTQ